ncbi:hypothetical protein [Streptomyces griseus]|uniref:hypothetical protein n=1 Tax=Streptomyces griseus TaxID=1911 RepID=UPI003682D3F3
MVIGEGLERFQAESFRKEDQKLRAWVQESANALGHLDGVRDDAIFDLGQAEKDANAYKKMLNYHVVGGLLTPIPMVGDAFQRGVDWGLSEGLNEENAKVDAETRKDRIGHYENGQEQMQGMLRTVALERGLTKAELDASPSEFETHLQANAKEWYLTGLAESKTLTGG